MECCPAQSSSKLDVQLADHKWGQYTSRMKTVVPASMSFTTHLAANCLTKAKCHSHKVSMKYTYRYIATTK